MNITNPRSIAWQLLSLTGKRAAMSGFAEGETHLQRRLHAEYRATRGCRRRSFCEYAAAEGSMNCIFLAGLHRARRLR